MFDFTTTGVIVQLCISSFFITTCGLMCHRAGHRKGVFLGYGFAKYPDNDKYKYAPDVLQGTMHNGDYDAWKEAGGFSRHSNRLERSCHF